MLVAQAIFFFFKPLVYQICDLRPESEFRVYLVVSIVRAFNLTYQ